MSHETIQTLIRIGGVMHIGIFAANALVPGELDWRGELAKVHPFLRRLVWVYGAFIVMTIAGFAALSLLLTGALANGTPLARAVCGFIALFWLARVVVAVFVLDPRPFLRNWLLKAGYRMLTAVFVYLAVVYALASIGPA